MSSSLQTGDAFHLEFDDLKGVHVDTRDMKGKYVVIDVWATWCKPCLASIPQLGVLWSNYKHKDFAMLSVSCDEVQSEVLKFVQALSITWPTYFSEQGVENPCAKAMGVQSIPIICLLGPDGKVLQPNISTAALGKFLEKTFGPPTKMNSDQIIEMDRLNSNQSETSEPQQVSPSYRLSLIPRASLNPENSNKNGKGKKESMQEQVKRNAAMLESRLDELITDKRSYPLTRDAFTNFLRARFCEEQFLFLVDTHELLDKPPEQEQAPTEKVEKINKTYLVEDAPHQINISQNLRRTTMDQVDKAGGSLDKLRAAYRPAQKESSHLIQAGDYINKFIESQSQNINAGEKGKRKMRAVGLLGLALGLVLVLVLLEVTRWARLAALPLFFLGIQQYVSARQGI
eukprot:g76979.t1